jgi:hypothetical protein
LGSLKVKKFGKLVVERCDDGNANTSFLTTTLLGYFPAEHKFNNDVTGSSHPGYFFMGISHKAGSLKINTALEYSTRVVQEGGRRCKN